MVEKRTTVTLVGEDWEKLMMSFTASVDQLGYLLESSSRALDALTAVLKGTPAVVERVATLEAQGRYLRARLKAVEGSWRDKKSVPHSRQHKDRKGVATRPEEVQVVTQPDTVTSKNRNGRDSGGQFNPVLRDLKSTSPK